MKKKRNYISIVDKTPLSWWVYIPNKNKKHIKFTKSQLKSMYDKIKKQHGNYLIINDKTYKLK